MKVTGRPDWEALLDAPTLAPAWPAVLQSASGPERVTPSRVGGTRKEEEELRMMKGAKLGSEGEEKVKAALEELTKQLISMEQRLNELDSGCGDGDCGSTLAAGAKAIQVGEKSVSVKARRSRNRDGLQTLEPNDVVSLKKRVIVDVLLSQVKLVSLV